MGEGGIRLEELKEDDLELHRQMCVVRLMFRCSLCNGDYVSKEGLWNHLDLHEIVDESKELHYQEIKAKHKLHQCVLCNDQRAYSESPYWKHVHDVHDGFFLRCSDCGENFRSEKLRNDHASSPCKARNFVELDFKEESDPFEVDAEHLKLSREGHSRKQNQGLDIQLSEQSAVNLITINKADNRFACDICGIRFSARRVLLRHKSAKYSCMEGGQQQCPHCGRVFQIKEYQAHFPCEKNKYSCELCPMKFPIPKKLASHMRHVHGRKGVRKSEKQDQNQVKNITAKQGIVDKNVQLPVENQSSTSSSTMCVHCGKECSSTGYLRRHIAQVHLWNKCDICGITFQGYNQARKHELTAHNDVKHKRPCAWTPLQKDSSSLKSSGKVIVKDKSDSKVAGENPSSEESSTKCSNCGIEESSAYHILMHHEPVACDFCGITLASLSKAEHHLKTMHKESQFKCPHCSMQCSTRHRLQKHLSKCNNARVLCDFCGKLFKDVIAVATHRKNFCHAYKRSKEQEQKTAETSLCDETDSSAVMEKITPPLDESVRIKCDYCSDVYSSPGYLNHHLKVFHQLTKCDICGITVLGLSATQNHKIKCHKELTQECVAEKGSQPLAENPSNHSYSCNICGITFQNYTQIYNHKLTKHTEGKLKCPHCSRKFHYKYRLMRHVSCCADLKYLCDLCGQKFTNPSSVESHKKQDHLGIKPLGNAKIEGADCTAGQKQNGVEKMVAAMERPSCINCRNTFASTDELRKHKLTCTNPAKEHDGISLFHDVKEAQFNTTIVQHGENIEIKLEINVEETMLQEQEYQIPNEDPGRSTATTLHPHGGESKDVDAEHAEDLENGIKVKTECVEDEEEITIENPAATESVECQEVPRDRNESILYHEVMDVHSKVAKRKRHSLCEKLSSDCAEPRRSIRIRLNEIK